MQNANSNDPVDRLAILQSKSIKTIEAYIKSIKEDTEAIRSYTKSLNRFIGAEGEIIETDINSAIEKYLCYDTKFSKFYIYRSKWKYLNKENVVNIRGKRKIYRNPNLYTEFDGLYIASTHDIHLDEEYAVTLKSPKINNSNPRIKVFFIVVESKHSIDESLFFDKLDKMKEFQEYITKSRNSEYVKQCTIEYQEKVSEYKLDTVSTDLYWFIGAKRIDPKVVRIILNKAMSLKQDDNINLNFLQPGGNGYILYEYDNDFKENNLVYGNVKSNTVTSKKVQVGYGTKSFLNSK
jgi:hypothetical protein